MCKGFILLLSIVLIFIGCTCGYDFDYAGIVLDESNMNPISGVEIRTLDYDLYAIDPEEHNSYDWGDVAQSDSSGVFVVTSSGLYDCGPGRPDIDDPGDLGIIYFSYRKNGYTDVDTFFVGDNLTRENGKYLIPKVLMLAN